LSKKQLKDIKGSKNTLRRTIILLRRQGGGGSRRRPKNKRKTKNEKWKTNILFSSETILFSIFLA